MISLVRGARLKIQKLSLENYIPEKCLCWAIDGESFMKSGVAQQKTPGTCSRGLGFVVERVPAYWRGIGGKAPV